MLTMCQRLFKFLEYNNAQNWQTLRPCGGYILVGTGQQHKWVQYLVFYLHFKVYLSILRERETEQRRGKERGRERIPSRLDAISTAPTERGLISQTMRSWPELRSSQALNSLSHLGGYFRAGYNWECSGEASVIVLSRMVRVGFNEKRLKD